jgi:hypothetical protein
MRAFSTVAIVLLFKLVALAPTVSADQSPPAPPYRVIVHSKNPANSLDRTFLQDAFLKKIRHWPSGSVVQPVDLSPANASRLSFSREVLGRSVAAVRAYWQQRTFSGRDVPPRELVSDEQVVEYVLAHEGGIGYVGGATPLAGTKAVSVSR